MNIDQVRFIEEISANAWHPETTQHLDGWLLGYSGGTSRRVNSVLPHHLNPPENLEERMHTAEEFYRRSGRPVQYKISPAALPANLPDILQAQGFQPYTPTMVQIASLSDMLEEAPLPPNVEVTISDTLTDAWFQAYTIAAAYAPESLPVRRGILSRVGPAGCFALLHADGQAAATGLGVVERGWMGVFCVVTFPQFRRRGFARQIMQSLAAWAVSQGAHSTYLQVEEKNAPAITLYANLGYKKLYSYVYLAKET